MTDAYKNYFLDSYEKTLFNYFYYFCKNIFIV
jgi:hypothetical protein